MPAAVALASCAANNCGGFCLRGAVSQLVVRAFAQVAAGYSLSDKAKMKPIHVTVLRLCAALRLDVYDGTVCHFGVGLGLRSAKVEKDDAEAFCQTLVGL